MSGPRPALAAYLADAFPRAEVTPITGDASARRFFRVSLADGSTRVVMDYGEPFAGEPGDVRANRLFQAASLRVATLLGSAPDPGCLILEDLGDRTLERALAESGPRERAEMYATAVDLAVAVADVGTRTLERSAPEGWPRLDEKRFRFEMGFFLEHYVSSLAGIPEPPAELVEALDRLAVDAAGSSRPILCHRDFHSRNLMVLPDRSLAMVDIQDARWGPDTYDLASLLRDGYVDLAEDEVDRGVGRYAANRPDRPDPEELRARFDVVAAQRMIKALGTFGRQIGLGRDRYLDAVPRTLARLRRGLSRRPRTAAVGEALERAGLLEPPERSRGLDP